MVIENLCPGCMTELKNGAETSKFCPACGYDMSDTSIPQHILKPHTILNNKYVVGKVLGEGGFGISYLGFDTMLEMKVAIKEFYPSGFATRDVDESNTVTAFTGEKGEFFENGRNKFIREARTLAKFANLPGIVSVRDFFEENNTSYIIMEFVEGETLKSFLKKAGGTLPSKDVLRMMEPVIKSLSQVHKQGIIHRDISPDNIMILPDGTMKLLDFGAARETSPLGGEKSVSVMLKPGYAPEEQYRSHGNQGPWTDVYGICGTIYRCLVGKAPVEAMERMRRDTLVDPNSLGAGLEPWQNAALMKGLSLYAENRYKSLDDFYSAFYLNQAPVSFTPPKIENAEYVNQTVANPYVTEADSVTVPLTGAPTGASYATGQMPGTNPAGMNMQNNSYAGPQYIYGQGNMQGSVQPGMQGGMPSGTPGKKKTWIIVLIVGIVALAALIGGIFALMGIGKKNRNKPENVISPTPSVTQTPAQNISPTPTPEPTDIPEPDIYSPGFGHNFDSDKEFSIGNAIGDSYGEYILLATKYGVAIVKENAGIYEFCGWYAELNEGIEIASIATYGDYLYLGCGASGIVKSDLINGGDMPIIIHDFVRSFAVVDDHIFYIIPESEFANNGSLYVCDLNGLNSQKLVDDVTCCFTNGGSSDFAYLNDKVYFLGMQGIDPSLICCDTDGSNIETVISGGDFLTLTGIFTCDGLLYSTDYNGMVEIDPDKKTVTRIVEGYDFAYFNKPFFMDDEVFVVADYSDKWMQVQYDSAVNGMSVSPLACSLTDGYLQLSKIDGKMFALYNYSDYYYIEYKNGAEVRNQKIEGLGLYDAADISNSDYNDNIDDASGEIRSNYTGYVDSTMSFIILKNNQWNKNHLLYTDSNEYFSLNDDENVGYFRVIGNEIFYSTYAEDVYNYKFYRQEIKRGSKPEALDLCAYDFEIRGTGIYYDDYLDGNRFYRYDYETGEKTLISDASTGAWCILGDKLFYEDLSNENICSIGLDGSGSTVMFSLKDQNIDGLFSMTAFDVNDYDFLSFITNSGEVYVCFADGSTGECMASGLDDIDIYQDVYFSRGYLYYLAGSGTEIHKVALEEYLENTGYSSAPEEIIYTGDVDVYEITGDLLFAQGASGSYEIECTDAYTGELYNTFNFSY